MHKLQAKDTQAKSPNREKRAREQVDPDVICKA